MPPDQSDDCLLYMLRFAIQKREEQCSTIQSLGINDHNTMYLLWHTYIWCRFPFNFSPVLSCYGDEHVLFLPNKIFWFDLYVLYVYVWINCLYVCPSVRLSVCLSVCLSVGLTVAFTVCECNHWTGHTLQWQL